MQIVLGNSVLADLEEVAERRVRQAREAEAKMIDFVMDTRSFRRDTVDEILGRRPLLTSHQAVRALWWQFERLLGGQFSDFRHRTFTLTPVY